MRICFHDMAIGRIGVGEENGRVTNLFFDSDPIPQSAELGETEIIRESFRQLEAYFMGDLKLFSLPFAPCGTDFMCAVWKNLCGVPYGQNS